MKGNRNTKKNTMHWADKVFAAAMAILGVAFIIGVVRSAPPMLLSQGAQPALALRTEHTEQQRSQTVSDPGTHMREAARSKPSSTSPWMADDTCDTDTPTAGSAAATPTPGATPVPAGQATRDCPVQPIGASGYFSLLVSPPYDLAKP